MFPLMIIAIGLAVLAFGKRLAVLGAAVGALLGVGLLRLFPDSSSSIWFTLGLPAALAAVGFFVAGFAKGIVRIIILVMGAVGGAAIVLAFFDLFNVDSSWVTWVLVILGGFFGLFLARRYRDWAMIVLAGLIGGFLVTRGLGVWFPNLIGALGTLVVLLLAGCSILYQGGLLKGVQFRRAARTPASAQTPAPPLPSTPATAPTTPPVTAPPPPTSPTSST